MKRGFTVLIICAVMSLLGGCGDKDMNENTGTDKTAGIQGVPEDTAPEQARVIAEITEIRGEEICVKPEDGAWELNSSDSFVLPADRLGGEITPEIGMWLEIIYSGSLEETYPARFKGLSNVSVASASGRRAETGNEEAGSPVEDKSRISVGGPYGEISVSIPDNWDGEAAPVDSNKMVYGSLYGMILRPQSAAEGWIELYCSDTFGVCGTGLEQEAITLAGNNVVVGTYDDHPYWDYMIMTAGKPQIIAEHTDCSSWTNEMWDEALDILDSMKFDTQKTEGGVGQYILESDNESIAVLMSVTNVTPTGLTIHFCQYEKRETGELIYGEGFHLERLNGETWEEVPTVIDNGAFNDLGYILPEEGEAEMVTDWEWLYGKLSPGTYRINKTMYDSNRTDPSVCVPVYLLTAQFIIAGSE